MVGQLEREGRPRQTGSTGYDQLRSAKVKCASHNDTSHGQVTMLHVYHYKLDNLSDVCHHHMHLLTIRIMKCDLDQLITDAANNITNS